MDVEELLTVKAQNMPSPAVKIRIILDLTQHQFETLDYSTFGESSGSKEGTTQAPTQPTGGPPYGVSEVYPR